MKLIKQKDNRGIKGHEFKYEVRQILNPTASESYLYLARLDRLNRNDDFGKEGYDQGALEFRLTYCPKTITVNKKAKSTSYAFFLALEGIYELGELMQGRFFKKFYYQLKKAGSFEPINKQKAFQILDQERIIHEEKLKKAEEARLAAKKKAKEEKKELVHELVEKEEL